MFLRPLKGAALVLALVCLSLSCVSLTVSAKPNQQEIVLAEGTPIKVIVTSEISSKDAKPNDPVSFTVTEDIAVDGQVVLRLGTPAVGSVVNAEKRGYMGKSGKLAIQVESTQTVDGTPLKLRAAKGNEGEDGLTTLNFISPFFLFKRGGDAKIEAGTPLTVYVATAKRFRTEGSTLTAIVDATGSAVSHDEATVYIYRPKKMVGGALEPSVFVDDIELARMDNGRYFAIKVKPGKHIIRLTDDKKGYAIDMGAGQTYYFRVGIEAGIWKGQGKITLDDEKRAVPEIKKLKFIGQDKVKAPTLVNEVSPK